MYVTAFFSDLDFHGSDDIAAAAASGRAAGRARENRLSADTISGGKNGNVFLKAIGPHLSAKLYFHAQQPAN